MLGKGSSLKNEPDMNLPLFLDYNNEYEINAPEWADRVSVGRSLLTSRNWKQKYKRGVI